LSIPDLPPPFPANLIHDDISELLDVERPTSLSSIPSSAVHNPYQAPQSEVRVQRVRQNGEIEITRIEYGDVMRTTWRIYKANVASCLAAWLLTFVCGLVSYSIVFALSRGLALAVNRLELGAAGLYVVVGVFLLSLVLLVCFFALGLMKFSLNIARGGPIEMNAVFGAAPILVAGSAVILIMFLGSALGIFLLVIPGLLCAILLGLAPIALVDRNEGILPSLKLSAQVMSRNLLPAFLLLFSVNLAANVVSTFTCGLGGLLAFPFQMLLAITIYLRATGQPTAYDAPVETR
jgi:uncharacterized membrane protein